MDVQTNTSKRLQSYSRYKNNKGLTVKDRDIYLEDKVSPSISKYDNTPHFLMELSKQEYAILKDNCIHVGEVSFIKDSVSSKGNMNSIYATVNKGKKLNVIK